MDLFFICLFNESICSLTSSQKRQVSQKVYPKEMLKLDINIPLYFSSKQETLHSRIVVYTLSNLTWPQLHRLFENKQIFVMMKQADDKHIPRVSIPLHNQ